VGWASHHISKLKNGETVKFRPKGHSMTGRVNDGELCTVEPVNADTVEVGDVVLCTVHGRQFLHLVKAKQDGRFQIGNNKGHINGWVGHNGIHGKLVKVEP
jgi:SOS-response transcriptional repressor LexA